MTHAFCPHCGFDLEASAPIKIGAFEMRTPDSDLLVGGGAIHFPTSERIILHTLMLAAPNPVDRLILRERIGTEADGNVLDVFISRIRARITAAGFEPPIKTVWGVGYAWAAETTTGGE